MKEIENSRKEGKEKRRKKKRKEEGNEERERITMKNGLKGLSYEINFKNVDEN
jgi:hypothetical protein